MKLIDIDYSNVLEEEVTANFLIDEIQVTISILPVPDTTMGLVTVMQENEPLIINRVIVTNDPIISFNNANVEFSGDFIFAYSSTASSKDTFDISRLGYDLFLWYVEEDDYAS